LRNTRGGILAPNCGSRTLPSLGLIPVLGLLLRVLQVDNCFDFVNKS